MTTPAPVSRVARHPREPLTVDLGRGRLRAGGHEASFDPAAPDALELAYLHLVRRMRDVHRDPSFVLRSDDVTALARALDRDAVSVLQRLGELMGATVTQRRSMVTAFLAGTLLIVVATGAVALAGGDTPDAVTADRLGDDPVVTGSAESRDELDPTPPPSAEGAPAEDRAEPADAGTEPTSDAVPARSTTDRPATDPPARSRDAVAPSAPAPDPDRAGADDGQPEPGGEAAPVEGEADAWEWGPPQVDQPGAVIDLPSEPEVVQPGATIDLPPDDDGDVDGR